MNIDESFKDLKSLLNLEKVMNKKKEELGGGGGAPGVDSGLLVGEALRDRMYGGKGEEGSNPHPHCESQGKS